MGTVTVMKCSDAPVYEEYVTGDSSVRQNSTPLFEEQDEFERIINKRLLIAEDKTQRLPADEVFARLSEKARRLYV